MNRKNTSILFLLLFSMMASIHSQQLTRIRHLSGTQVINGIGVTVTQSGKVEELQYCGDDTGPYYLGYNYSSPGAGDGSYTFTFTKPVDEIVLNLAAMSHTSGSYGEQAKVYVNGVHYVFTSLGTLNNCGEQMAIITREGDISPCAECTGSGTNGVKIKGPITSIKIEGDIIFGEPNGFVVGVWMSGKANDAMVSYKADLGESAAGEGKELYITGPLENAKVVIKDANGNPLSITYRTIEKSKLVINASEWPSGEYILEIEQNKKIERVVLKIPTT